MPYKEVTGSLRDFFSPKLQQKDSRPSTKEMMMPLLFCFYLLSCPLHLLKSYEDAHHTQGCLLTTVPDIPIKKYNFRAVIECAIRFQAYPVQ